MDTSFEEVMSLRSEVDEVWSLMTNFKVDYSETRSCVDDFFDIIEDCLSKRKELFNKSGEATRVERLKLVQSELASALDDVKVLPDDYKAEKDELHAMEARVANLRSVVSKKRQRYLQSKEDVKKLMLEERTLLEAPALSDDDSSLLQRLDGLMKDARDFLSFNTLK